MAAALFGGIYGAPAPVRHANIYFLLISFLPFPDFNVATCKQPPPPAPAPPAAMATPQMTLAPNVPQPTPAAPPVALPAPPPAAAPEIDLLGFDMGPATTTTTMPSSVDMLAPTPLMEEPAPAPAAPPVPEPPAPAPAPAVPDDPCKYEV